MHHSFEARELLHSRQLKATPLREATLNVIYKSKKPLSAEEITAQLHALDFDQASLFRSLKIFSEKGIINPVDLAEGFLRYEGKCEEHSHHHHIMCQKCKKISVIPFCIPQKIVAYLTQQGYTDLSHRMDFSGVCKKCSG